MKNNNKSEEQQNQQNEEQNWMSNYNQHHKNLTGGSPKQSNITGKCY